MLRGNRLAQAESIFQEALSIRADRRAEALERLCGKDLELRSFVEQLLASDERTQNDFLESPILDRGRAATDSTEYHPERIGRYLILGKIGQGGMGVVYEARQEQPSRTIALKVIAPGMTSRHLIRRFQHEAEVLGQLQHPGIAHIYEAGVAEVTTPGGTVYEQPYLAMELIHGSPLNEYTQSRGLGNRQRLELVARICDAVHHAHQKGIIHRDLKPANILVVEEGDSTTGHTKIVHAGTSAARRAEFLNATVQPKVLDFGVARMTESDVHTVTLRTDAGQLIGTVPYMSPEQVSGDPSRLDMRSDVYALGVILYELLSGRLPIDVRNRSIPEAVRLIQEEEPSRLSSVNTVFRGDVETIVARAMEKDRERRYSSAAELAADIRRYLRDEPIVARPHSAMYQLRKFARRNKALVGGAAAVFVTLLLGLVGMAWFAMQESHQRQLAESLLADAQAARDAENVQRQRAEERFSDVRALARTFIFDVYNEIEGLAGATQAREKILATALTYLDRLAEEAGDDPDLLKELAEGYARLGEVFGKPSKANLGDTAAALENHEKALAIVKRLAELKPDDPVVLSALAGSHDSIGTTLRAIGRTDEAIEHFEAHLRISENLAAAYPDQINYVRAAAYGHATLGRMHWVKGQLHQAREAFERYDAFAAASMEDNPNDTFTLNNRSIMAGLLGQIHLELDEPETARERFEQALEISERVVALHPQNANYRSVHAGNLSQVGRVLMRLGDTEQGLKNIMASCEIREQMAAEDPSDFRSQRNHAVCAYTLGDAYEQLGRLEESLLFFERYRERLEDLAAANTSFVVLQRDLALGYQRVGKTLNMLKRPEEALAPMTEALDRIQQLAHADPTDALAELDVALVHYDRGAILCELGNNDQISPDARLQNYREARTHFVTALQRLEKMQSADRLPPERLKEINKSKSALRECDEQIGRLESSTDRGEEKSRDG